MTQAKDLVGLPPLTQNQLGLQQANIIAAGTTSADATVCGNQATAFVLTATGSDGIRMNAATPLLTPIWVFNTSGSNGKVYPQTGGNVNGGSTDAGETIGTTTVQIWVRLSNLAWAAVLGA